MRLSARIAQSAILAPFLALPGKAFAQIYDGGGITEGVQAAAGLGLANGNPFQIALSLLRLVLNFLGFIAVITIVIAGIYMIISLGNDEQIEKAKKIIKYTLIGLAVILFSRLLVSLITVYLYSAAR